jgi:cytoskeletal protein RodZ
MSKNYTIDSLFKEQLSNMDFSNADAMWQRMETKLQQQKEKQNRKRYLLWLLLIPVAAGLLLTAGKTNHKKTNAGAAESSFKQITKTKSELIIEAAVVTKSNITSINSTTSNKTVSYCPVQPGWYKNGVFVPSKSVFVSPGIIATTAIDGWATTIIVTDGAQQNEEIEALQTVLLQPAGKIAVEKITAIPGVQQQQLLQGHKIGIIERGVKSTANENKANNKLQVSAAAGTDIFAKSKPGGKYAMLQFRMQLNKTSSFSLGAGISSHSTSQSYIVAEKQATLNREVDAKLRGLTMLQFPVMYEQALPGKRFTAKTGVTPVYILNAAVVNVPNSFVGVVIPYRSFGLSDINRFNVLFTAGLHYYITPKVGVELRGNYGLTELVKNSYLNQSNENNNFKAVQLGLSWNFGKK